MVSLMVAGIGFISLIASAENAELKVEYSDSCLWNWLIRKDKA